jgi:hypothetical protein
MNMNEVDATLVEASQTVTKIGRFLKEGREKLEYHAKMLGEAAPPVDALRAYMLQQDAEVQAQYAHERQAMLDELKQDGQPAPRAPRVKPTRQIV